MLSVKTMTRLLLTATLLSVFFCLFVLIHWIDTDHINKDHQSRHSMIRSAFASDSTSIHHKVDSLVKLSNFNEDATESDKSGHINNKVNTVHDFGHDDDPSNIRSNINSNGSNEVSDVETATTIVSSSSHQYDHGQVPIGLDNKNDGFDHFSSSSSSSSNSNLNFKLDLSSPSIHGNRDRYEDLSTTEEKFFHFDINTNMKSSHKKAVLYPILRTIHREAYSTYEDFRSKNRPFSSSHKRNDRDSKRHSSQNDEERDESSYFNNPMLDPLKRVYKAMRDGDLCDQDALTNAEDGNESLKTALVYLMKMQQYNSLLEFTSESLQRNHDSVSWFTASAMSNVTCLQLYLHTNSENHIEADIYREDNKNRNINHCISKQPVNLYVSESFTDIDSIWGKYNCLQIFDNLNPLKTDKLPFEFEEYLGKVLCQCRETLIPKALPDDAYFTYWSSVEHLLSSAIATAEGVCDGAVNYDLLRNVGYKQSRHLSAIRSSFTVFSRDNHTVLSHQGFPVHKVSHLQLNERSQMHLLTEIISFDKRIEYITPNITFSSYGDTQGGKKSNTVCWQNLVFSGAHFLSMDSSKGEETLRHGRSLRAVFADEYKSSASKDNTDKKDSLHSDIAETAGSSSSSSKSSSSSSASSSSSDYKVNGRTSSSSSSSIDSEGSSDSPHVIPNLDMLTKTSWMVSKEKESMIRREFESASRGLPLTDFWYSVDESTASVMNGTDNSAFSAKSKIGNRARNKHKFILVKEKSDYKKWSQVLHLAHAHKSINNNNVDGLSDLKQSSHVQIIGRSAVLLAIKVAQIIRKDSREQGEHQHGRVSNIVIPVMTNVAQESALVLESLAEMMQVNNIIPCYPRLPFGPIQLAALSASPEIADMKIVQIDVVASLFSSAMQSIKDNDNTCLRAVELFEEMISSILISSRILYIELPTIERLELLFDIIRDTHSGTTANNCYETLKKRYDSSENIIKYSIEKLNDYPSRGSTPGKGSVNVHLLASKRPSSTQIFRVSVKMDNMGQLSMRMNNNKKKNSSINHGISIYSLIHLGVTGSIKTNLLRQLLKTTHWYHEAIEQNNYRSWNLFVSLLQGVGENAIQVSYIKPTTTYSSTIFGETTLHSDVVRAMGHWNTLKQELDDHNAELANGKFSFVEYGSTYGHLSSLMSLSYPNATIISLALTNDYAVKHVSLVNKMNIKNNVVCELGDNVHKASKSSTRSKSNRWSSTMSKKSDHRLRDIIKNVYDSPELFRFQFAGDIMIDYFGYSSTNEDSYRSIDKDLKAWGKTMGALLSSALTTFIITPDSTSVSFFMELFFGHDEFSSSFLSGPYRPLYEMLGDPRFKNDNDLYHHYKFSDHPVEDYKNFDHLWLLGVTKAYSGQTQLKFTRLINKYGLPIIRGDIVNMTRHVHHHYDYSLDGHKRTYTMKIAIDEEVYNNVSLALHSNEISKSHYEHNGDNVLLRNEYNKKNMIKLPLGLHPLQNNIVSVKLARDKDSFPIPYTVIQGVTLICILRLGLEESQRESLYAKFLKLPLYEDMAPWNIILSGPNMDYIDYDTRGITYDVEIPDAYKVMTALMNYERSVKDFHKCGSKARTIYGIPFISDCVGASFNQIDQDSMPKCGSDLAYPVPCIDGKCHSDYISCLKSMNNDENHRDGNGNNNSSMNDSEWWNTESDRIMSKSLLDNIFNGTSVYSLG